MAEVTAESARKILDDHPVFAKAVAQFMTLYDAAQVLDELKPPNGELAAEYLKEIAGTIIRDTGLPENFIEAMIKARPPMPGSEPT